jgi:hypothetical protein
MIPRRTVRARQRLIAAAPTSGQKEPRSYNTHEHGNLDKGKRLHVGVRRYVMLGCRVTRGCLVRPWSRLLRCTVDVRCRIRHYGLLAGGVKADNLALARKLLDVAPPAPEPEYAASDPATRATPCPCCGSAMQIIEVFKAGELPRHRPTVMPAAIRIDTS